MCHVHAYYVCIQFYTYTSMVNHCALVNIFKYSVIFIQLEPLRNSLIVLVRYVILI